MVLHTAPWEDRGEESPPPSALLSTPQFLSAQQEIPPSSPSFSSEDGLIYCLSPENIAYYPDTLLSLHDDLPIIENSSTQLPVVSGPEEATPVEQSQLYHTILSANRQELENPSTNERSPVRWRRTEDGDQPSSPPGRSYLWTKRRINIGDLSESTQNELKSLIGRSEEGEMVLPPILEVASGEVSRPVSVSDEGYFSKQNSGHACLEPMLGHTPDDSSPRFACDLDGRSFNRASDLDRHRHDVHPNEYPPAWIFPCPVPGCVRGAQPFARRDKCIAHLRQRHTSNHLPILRLENPNKNSTTSCYAGASRTESIQSTRQNHRESHSTVLHQVRGKHLRSDPTLNDSTITSDSESDTSETSHNLFSSSAYLAKPQSLPIGLSSNEEGIAYRSKDKQSQIERYLNDAASDPANHRLVAFPAHKPVQGENPTFSWRTGQNTTSSRGKKNGNLGTHSQETQERSQKRPRTSGQISSYPNIRPRVESVIQPNQEYADASGQGQDTNIAGPEHDYVRPTFRSDEDFASARNFNHARPDASEDLANSGFSNVQSPYHTQPSRRQSSTQPPPTVTDVHPSHELQRDYDMDSATVPSYLQPIGPNAREAATAAANYQVHTAQQTTSTPTFYTLEDSNTAPFIANSVFLHPQTPTHLTMSTTPSYHSFPTPSPSSPMQRRHPSPQSLRRRNASRQQQAPEPPTHQTRTPPQSLQPNPPLLSYHTYDQYPHSSFSGDNTIDPSLLTPARSTAYQPSTDTPYTAPSLTMTRTPSTNRSDPSSQAPPEPAAYYPTDWNVYGTEFKPEDYVLGAGGNFSEDDVGTWPLDLEGPYQGN